MAKTNFSTGSIVTSEFLNGFQDIYFDGLDEDRHFDPLDVEDMNTSDTGNGLGTKLITLDTRQTVLQPKVFHNDPNTTPAPYPPGTSPNQYRFTDVVVGQDPTAQKHLTTKDYVDRLIDAINEPNVDYGSGNSSPVIVQQVKSSIDLSTLQPRFRGEVLGSYHDHFVYNTPWTDVEGRGTIIRTPSPIDKDAGWLNFSVRTHPGQIANQNVRAVYHLLTPSGKAIPIGELAYVSQQFVYVGSPFPVYNFQDSSICMVPIPTEGWSAIYGYYEFKQVQGSSSPIGFCISSIFYDKRVAQKYFIIPDPADVSKVVVIGPDKMQPPGLVGSGLGITQNVVDGELKATLTYSVNSSFTPGNPTYSGSTTVPLSDIEVIYEFKSRTGDPNNLADPLNSNSQPGFVFGGGHNTGTSNQVTSGSLPAGEFIEVTLRTAAPDKDTSEAITLNFQANSPSTTNVPAAFAMTAPTDTSINITWTAVAGVKYLIEVEEMGDGIVGKPKKGFSWSSFPTGSSYYRNPDSRITGSAGNITITGANSGTTYRATIMAAAPNSFPSLIQTGTPPNVNYVSGAVAQVTTTGTINEVAFGIALHGTSLADLVSKVPNPSVPAGAIGVVSAGADKGIYIYSPNFTPSVWVKL